MKSNSELIRKLAELCDYTPEKAQRLHDVFRMSGMDEKRIINYIEANGKVELTERLVDVESSLLFEADTNSFVKEAYAKSRLANNTVQQALDFAYNQVKQVKKKDYVVGVLRDMGIVSAICAGFAVVPYLLKMMPQSTQKEDPTIQKDGGKENRPQLQESSQSEVSVQAASATIDYAVRQPRNAAVITWNARKIERV